VGTSLAGCVTSIAREPIIWSNQATLVEELSHVPPAAVTV
jgi:hypothetical protein